MTKPDIQSRIQDLGLKQLQRLDLKADDVLRELLLIAKLDIGKLYDERGELLPVHEMPEEARRAIAGIEVFEEFDGRGEDRVKTGDVRKVKLWEKPKALELLGKYLKLFMDRVEHSGAVSLEQLLSKAGKPKEETK